MKKLMNWIVWNTLCLMPKPEYADYPRCFSEYSEIDPGYEAFCGDCQDVDAFNNLSFTQRWAERRSWKIALKQAAKRWEDQCQAMAEEYDPFAEDYGNWQQLEIEDNAQRMDEYQQQADAWSERYDHTVGEDFSEHEAWSLHQEEMKELNAFKKENN